MKFKGEREAGGIDSEADKVTLFRTLFSFLLFSQRLEILSYWETFLS